MIGSQDLDEVKPKRYLISSGEKKEYRMVSKIGRNKKITKMTRMV